MPRIVLSLEEWRAVARELAAAHTIAAPPGLSERMQALLTQAHDGWVDHAVALELDEGSAEIVRSIHRTLTGMDSNAGQRSASVAEADTIVRDHQRRP
jgi:hypothetical protein